MVAVYCIFLKLHFVAPKKAKHCKNLLIIILWGDTAFMSLCVRGQLQDAFVLANPTAVMQRITSLAL